MKFPDDCPECKDLREALNDPDHSKRFSLYCGAHYTPNITCTKIPGHIGAHSTCRPYDSPDQNQHAQKIWFLSKEEEAKQKQRDEEESRRIINSLMGTDQQLIPHIHSYERNNTMEQHTREQLEAKGVVELRQIAREMNRGGVEILARGFSKDILIERILSADGTINNGTAVHAMSLAVPPQSTQPIVSASQTVAQMAREKVTAESSPTVHAKERKRTEVKQPFITKVRIIKTKLVGRDELFRVLALGESLKFPVLFIGEAGIAKSQALYDYVQGLTAKVFKIELDLGTKPSEIKGYMNLKKYMEENIYETISPITEATHILINEVEKGSSELRNTMLSAMRERELQLGSEGARPLSWELFVGTSNGIPSEELRDPFWDRWVIKEYVARIPVKSMPKLWDNDEIELEIPILNGELDSIPVNMNLIEKAGNIIHDFTTDRTLSYMPKLVRGVKGVWGFNDLQAIVKVVGWIAKDKLADISQKLVPKQYAEILGQIALAEKAYEKKTFDYYIDIAEKQLIAWIVIKEEKDLKTELEERVAFIKTEGAKA